MTRARPPVDEAAGCVDVVLNSLAGESAAASVLLLRPFGRFLELGKRDAYENNAAALPLSAFLRGLSYSAAHLDVLMLERPDAAAALLGDVWKALPTLPPLPQLRSSAVSLGVSGGVPRPTWWWTSARRDGDGHALRHYDARLCDAARRI